MSLRTIPDVEIFQAGRHNGAPYTVEDLLDMARNSVLLKDRHTAPVGIGHGDSQPVAKFSEAGEASFGIIPNLRVEYRTVKGEPEPVATLVANFEEVPEYLAGLVHNGSYRHVSGEIHREPPEWARIPGVKGKVLKRAVLLGKDLPGVKTLEDVTNIYRRKVPAETFSESRVQMQLSHRGETASADGSTLLFFSEADPLPRAAKPDAGTGDSTVGTGSATPTVNQDAAMTAEALETINKLTASNAALTASVATLTTEVATLKADTGAAKADATKALTFSEEQRDASVKSMVISRVNAARDAGKVTPAELDAGLVNSLMRHSTNAVLKFSDTETISPLEEALRVVESRPTVKFGSQTKTASPPNVEAEEGLVLKFAEENAEDFAKLGQKPTDVVAGFKQARTRNPELTASEHLGIDLD